ncbi:MAG: nuclear transport factor 2 family protein [Solirubrobacteraceae bacterium]
MTTTETTERRAANLAVIDDVYAAFGRGDVAAILDHIADDCRWEAWDAHTAQRAGVSYLAPRLGPAGVAEFCGAVAELQIHDFQVGDRLASDTQVAVQIVIDASTPSGGRFRDEELHLWTLDAGAQIVRMRHYVDTAKHIAAASGKDTTG